MAFQGDSIFWVEVEKIVPNPFQPRREFDEQKLIELSESVRMYGIMQPLTVTRKEIQKEDGTFYTEYELIAGERRLRASKLAGLSQVPVIIREGENNEQEKLELAIIENLQREDLNSVDRALAFRQLADVFGLSHVQVARKVGRSREYVSNSIRLLALPDYMLRSLRLAEMTEGHARTLLMLNDRPEEQDVVFREILMKKLSVREVERIVRKIATDKVRKKHTGEFDAELIEIEKKFMETLGTRVQIQKTDYGGQLTIDYFSVEDLEAMLLRMKHEEFSQSANLSAAALEVSKLSEHIPLNVAVDDSGGKEPADQSDEEILSPEPVKATDFESAEYSPIPVSIVDEASVPTERTIENSYSPVWQTEPDAPIVQRSMQPSQDSVLNDVVPTLAVYKPTPIPMVPTHVEESLVVEQPAPIAVVTSTPKEDDDSSMYSIRNFGV
jgi:ParB family transcriptional regulator, chromosome partitioning protein